VQLQSPAAPAACRSVRDIQVGCADVSSGDEGVWTEAAPAVSREQWTGTACKGFSKERSVRESERESAAAEQGGALLLLLFFLFFCFLN